MNKAVKVICLDCQESQETIYGQYGAEYSCIYCDAAPVQLVRG